MTLHVALFTAAGVPAGPGLLRRLRGSDLLVLPELFEGGYRSLRAGRPPLSPDDPALQSLRALSCLPGLTCIAGSVFLRRASGRRSNTSFIFARGRTIASYDKIHLFKPAGDHRFFRRGTQPVTFLVHAGRASIRVGVMICFDLRFPELSRDLARRGAEILVVPARWPRVRDDAWRTLLKARAIENQVFVIGCNVAGREGGTSYAFGPDGRLLHRSEGNGVGGLHRFTLTMEDCARARRLYDARRESVLLRRSRKR